MTVIYADSVLLSELAADFMLLLATDRLCGVNAGWKRLLLGALLGAVYALLCALLGGVMAAWPLKLGAAALMLLAAFGRRKGFLRRGAVFLLSSAAYAGIVLAVSLWLGGFGARGELFSFALAYALLGGILRFRAAGGGTVKVTLRNGERSLSLTALRDSGNSLRDPMSGAPALIAAEERLLPLLDPAVRLLLRDSRDRPPEERLELLWKSGAGRGFKLLPYRAVGVPDGLLLAFCPEEARIGGQKIPRLLAALSPGEVGNGDDFSAIVNGEF